MFKRILVTDWMNNLTVLGFTIFFVAFLVAVVWALCISRDRVSHLENLPLDSDQSKDE